MTDTVQVEGELNTDLWEELRKKYPELDDNSLLKKIVEEYSNVVLTTEEGEFVSELAEQKKLSESLRKKCKNFALRVKELEDIQGDQESTIEKLKKQNKKLSKGIPDYGDDAPVKEKIVYREDTKTINELKEKRDALQKTLWEKNAEIEKFDKKLTELNQTIDNYEAEKGKAYGFLVKLALDKHTSKYGFSFENISRGEFNKLMRSKVEFCKYKKISTPAAVIKLWDTETDEIDFIDLEEAVKELRNKSDVKLNEISIPYSEYENLKNIESKFPIIKEDHDKLKTDFLGLEEKNKQLLGTQEQLNKELTHLKTHPKIEEKIVYKENKKELEDLNAECERLRLKLFNYETGRMQVPTHGINVGNLYKVKILGVGKDGDGFTKVNNFIIFVPSTTKDQEVNIKITRVLKKYAFGKVSEGEPDGKVLDATSGSTESDAGVDIPDDQIPETMTEPMAEKEE
jgi:predicted RNA-binding protein with TRAM domain